MSFFSILTIGHFFSLLLETKGGREEEGVRERGRETLIGYLLYVPDQKNKPTTQACDLTRDQNHNLLVYRRRRQPMEPHQPGLICFFQNKYS